MTGIKDGYNSDKEYDKAVKNAAGGKEIPIEEREATLSSILAKKLPCTGIRSASDAGAVKESNDKAAGNSR